MFKKSPVFIIFFFILFAFELLAQGQQDGVFSLQQSDKSVYVVNVNSNITKSNLLQDYSDVWFEGRMADEKHRGFFQWNLPDDIIPDGSTITSVRFQIVAIQPSSNVELQAGFYTIKEDLEQAEAEDLWDKTDWFNNQKEDYIGSANSTNFTIDVTFEQGSDFVQAVENALLDDFFTLGIIDFNEVIHEYRYNFSKSDVRLEIHFSRPPVNVTINQVLDDEQTSIGEVKRWDGNNFISMGALPAHTDFYVGTQEALQADQNLFSDNPKQKYQQWNNLSDLVNHHVFSIDQETKNFTSYFNKTYGTLSVKVTLTNGGSGGSIWFKDPWLIDYADLDYGNNKRNQGMSAPFKQRQSPFTPDYTTSYNGDVYKGVFLEQGWPDWQPPYYSVKADAQQTFSAHGENITGYFLNWVGTDVDFQSPDNEQTPVVFHADGAEARAVYKGHLASSVARATGYNGGRRLAKDADDHLHLVYEDNGVIYYTKSTDGGENWNKETTLYSPSGENVRCAYPSIAYYNYKLFVVWVELHGTSSAYLYTATYDISNANPVWTVDMLSILDGDLSVKEPAPAIAVLTDENHTDYYATIAVDGYYNNAYHIKLWKSVGTVWYEWSEIGDILGLNPSISADVNHNVYNRQLALTYEHNNAIYVRASHWNDAGDVYWSDPEQVSENDADISEVSHSNVCFRNGYAHVVWQGLNNNSGLHEIFYRMIMPDQESGETISSAEPPSVTTPYSTVTTVAASSYNLSEPSVGVVSSQKAAVYYRKGSSVYKDIFLEQNYQNSYYYDEGKYPSVIERGLEDAVWTRYNDAPYVIKSDYAGPNGNPPLPIGPHDPWWGGVNKTLSADVNGGQEGHVIIDFLDFTYGGDTLTFNQALRTDSFAVSGDNVPLNLDMKAVFKSVNNLPPDNDVIFQLNYIDGTDTLFLTDLTYGELPRNPAPDGERFFKLTTVVNLGTRQGHFAFKLLDSDIAVRRIIRTMDEQSQSKSKAPLAVTPVSYILHQNFPNPFNPSTHITVELPQAGNMSLAVYNVKGQKVKDLLSGWQNAGIYEVVFDGRNLASGVYFYRLQAEDVVQTKRMLLVK